jgi:hypothetical protein
MTEENMNVAPQPAPQPKPATAPASNPAKNQPVKPGALKEMLRELGQKIVVLVLTTLLAAISGGVYTYNKEKDRDLELTRIKNQHEESMVRMGRSVSCNETLEQSK